MKQKLLSKLLAIAMVLTLLPAGVFATDEEAATLRSQIATSGTVTLDKDYTEDITIPADKNVTLDLNGKTLSNTNNGKATLSVEGTAVVKNGTIIGGTGYYNIEVKKGGSLTLENVTATAGNTGSSMIDNWGTMTIKSGTYTGGLDVVKSEEGSTLNIHGGKFTLNYSTSGYTGVILNYGTATITDGEFIQNATSGRWNHPQVVATGMVEGYPAITKITGGTFSNNKSGESIFHGLGKATSDNFEVSGGSFNKSVPSSYLKDGLVCEKDSKTNTYKLVTGATGVTLSESEKTIKVGESFKLEATLTPEDAELKSVTWTENSKKKIATVTKTSGVVKGVAIGDVTITATPNAAGATPATCTVHVYDEAAQIGKTIYPTLEQAIAAVQSGETIKLLKDIQVSKTIAVNKDFSIDLNGFTLTGKSSTSLGCRVFTVANSGKLMLTGTGVVTIGASIKNGSSSSVIDVAEGGALAIGEKVTITTGHCNGISVAGTAEMNGTVEVTKSGFHAVTSTGTATIKEGYYNGSFDGTITIFGGYFTSDPTDYVADNYIAGTSDVTGYDYKVVEKTNTGSIVVKPAVAAPEVKVSDSISKEDQTKVEAAAKTVSAPTLGAAAGDKVAAISKADAESLVAKAETLTNPTLYVQTALKVEPTAYDAENKTLALEITPQYRIVASTATTADDIELGDSGKNAQVVQDYQTMNITKATEVTMELPAGFAVADGDKLSVKHTKSDDAVEYYTGTVTKKDDKFYLTFTTNGFSPFVISAPAASIGENVYPTLQAAVDAVSNGQTIKILKADETAVVNRTVKFTVAPDGKAYTINLGAYCTDKDEAANVFDIVYTTPVYTPITKKDVKFDDVDVNAYYAPAVKWAVENKITAGKTDKLFAPDDTCTRGEMITFLWNAAGKPAAKNTTNPFTDVNVGAFYYDAVLWAVSNGITSGTSDTTFSPDNTVSRAQVVAFLYNYANKPAAANSTFSDVAADAYYAPAVGWAAAQKITSGTGNNTFSPENDCTRAQIVTFLYNDLAK